MLLFEKFPLLETERIILRKLITEDVNNIFQIYSDSEAMKYRLNKPLLNKEDALKMIHKTQQSYEEKKSIRWAIEYKETNTCIGTFLCEITNEENTVKIGYSLNKQYWNKGIMSEILPVVEEYLIEKEQIENIVAKTHENNIASIKLLEKYGFKKLNQSDEVIEYLKLFF